MPTPQQNNQRDEGLRDELRAIGQSLQVNGRDIAARLDDIDRKQQAQTQAFTTAMADLRRELMSMFVAKNEYEPRHAILVDKLAKIDKVLEERQVMVQDYYTVKAHVAQNALDIEELQKHNSGLMTKVLGFGAFGIAAASFILTLLQHVQIR